MLLGEEEGEGADEGEEGLLGKLAFDQMACVCSRGRRTAMAPESCVVRVLLSSCSTVVDHVASFFVVSSYPSKFEMAMSEFTAPKRLRPT